MSRGYQHIRDSQVYTKTVGRLLHVVASGPLVTTMNDCVSTIIYLSVASGMLSYLI